MIIIPHLPANVNSFFHISENARKSKCKLSSHLLLHSYPFSLFSFIFQNDYRRHRRCDNHSRNQPYPPGAFLSRIDVYMND